MSTIRKKPYIETILELLDSTKLNTLLTLLNSGGTSQPLTWSEEYGIYPVFFENKSGILIHTSTLSCVIFYTQYQSLILADLDYDTHNYTIINENCDINEIRRIIGDAMNSGEVEEIATDSILSKTLVGGSSVELAGFNTTDNHWHIANSKVDDTFTIDGELELGSGDLGSNLQNTIKEIALPDTTSQIGKYLKVGNEGPEWADVSGGKYQHNIALRFIKDNSDTIGYYDLTTNTYVDLTTDSSFSGFVVYFNIITNRATEYTASDLVAYLKTQALYIQASGQVFGSALWNGAGGGLVFCNSSSVKGTITIFETNGADKVKLYRLHASRSNDNKLYIESDDVIAL